MAENVSPGARPVATAVQLVCAEPTGATPISTATVSPSAPTPVTSPESVAERKPAVAAPGATATASAATERQRTISVPQPPEWPGPDAVTLSVL